MLNLIGFFYLNYVPLTSHNFAEETVIENNCGEKEPDSFRKVLVGNFTQGKFTLSNFKLKRTYKRTVTFTFEICLI